MIQIDIDCLLKEITSIIKEWNFKIHRLHLDEPYGAANSGHCPFGIPSELHASEWLQEKAKNFFRSEDAKEPRPIRLSSKTMFKELFEVC